MAGLAEKLLNLPAFLLGVLMLYWSVPLSVLLGEIKFWKLHGKRDDAYGWGKGLQKLFGIKLLQLPGPSLYTENNVIYLANHRSWADFFLDVVMTDGRAQMLSRMAVMTVFPAFMIPVCVIKSVILFNRGQRINKNSFNERINRKMKESPVEGLIVYPEGHRSTKAQSLTLKRGMLHYCFDHKRTVQIVMTRNKEAVLSEKDMRCNLGQTCLVGYAQPIDPSKFASFEEFLAAVQKSWDDEWGRVYSADLSDGKKKVCASYDTHEYSNRMKAQQIVATGGSCIAFFVTMYWSIRGLTAFLGLLGPLQGVTMGALAIWTAISLARAFRPLQLPRTSKT